MEMITDDLKFNASRNLLKDDKKRTISPLKVVRRCSFGRTKYFAEFIMLHTVMLDVLEHAGFESDH